MMDGCEGTCSGPLYCWYVLAICIFGSLVGGFIVGVSVA